MLMFQIVCEWTGECVLMFQVILHRLSWQKVWTLAPPDEGETVGGLAWRPDGKGTHSLHLCRSISLTSPLPFCHTDCTISFQPGHNLVFFLPITSAIRTLIIRFKQHKSREICPIQDIFQLYYLLNAIQLFQKTVRLKC